MVSQALVVVVVVVMVEGYSGILLSIEEVRRHGS